MTSYRSAATPNDPQSIWLGRYLDPRPIRARGPLRLVSARRALDESACVVLVPGTSAGATWAAAAFAERARVHALLDHPLIPKVAARGVAEGIPYLEMACDAVIDGEGLHGLLLDAGRKVPHEAAAGLHASLRQAMRVAHGVIDPRRGAPVCLGRVASADVLFSPEGRWYLVGWGRSTTLERAGSGRGDELFGGFEAPEVAVGGEPTPAGDYVALSLLGRSLLHVVDVNAVIARVLVGDLGPADLELIERLRWFEQHVVGAPARLRKSIAEAEVVVRRIHEICGVTPDLAGFTALVADLLAGREPPRAAQEAADADTPELLLGFEPRWVAGADGVRHPLGEAHGRIVTALVERHHEAPGASLTVQDLLEAGWPGERPMAEAGANRVYVALTQLRRMGLRGVIERDDGGYRLKRRTVVRLVAPSAQRTPSQVRRRAR